MEIIRDTLSEIQEVLFKDKVIVIYGTRRVGKTTLAQHILNKYPKKRSNYFNCEDVRIRRLLEDTTIENFRRAFSQYDLVVFDEAQIVRNIGFSLKLLHDSLPKLQIIATGSSSFELSNKIGEPLVGRARYFTLYPFSLNEITTDFLQTDSSIEHILRFGLYPTVVNKSEKEMKREITDITNGYLYKDIFALEGLKHSQMLTDLLTQLALQVGSEVSYNELASSLRISIETLQKYIELLEKCFVLFVLPAFSRNLRKEVGKKTRKIYFYDLGVRNAIINQFAPLNLRNDVGALWENFCITELIKKAHNKGFFPNNYFWRTYEGKEIDFIEESDGILNAYEFKYSPNQKVKVPKIFMDEYKPHFSAINRENYAEYLL